MRFCESCPNSFPQCFLGMWRDFGIQDQYVVPQVRPARQPSRERLCYRASASATGLQQDICACVSVPVSMWPQKVRRLDDSLLPRRLLPAGLWRAGEEGQALLLPLPALAAAQALSLLPLCPAHGGWRSVGKHPGMDSSLSTSGRSLWALPGCCDRGELGCWTWTRLCSFRSGPAGGGGEEGPPPNDFLTLFPLSPPYSTP